MSKEQSSGMDKEMWTGIFKCAGFSDEDMHKWHRAFEKMYPEKHQAFLEHIAVPAEEIEKIRQWSR